MNSTYTARVWISSSTTADINCDIYIRVKRVHATRTIATKALGSVVVVSVVANKSSLDDPFTMAGFPDTSSNKTTPNEYTSTIGDTSPKRAYLKSKPSDYFSHKITSVTGALELKARHIL